MTFIRQTSLFSIQELCEMEPTHRYDAIISTIDLDKIYYAVKKQSRLGAPEELNHANMIISVFIGYVESIPTIKDLVKRLSEDIACNKRIEPEFEGFDKYFTPTCFRERSFRYDSYDAKRETLKYTRPKECADCPLERDGICQKVFKMKITKDLRG